MATYTVTTSNWNDPAFWSSISEAGGGHTLDFSGLTSAFWVDWDPDLNRIIMSDGTNTFIVTDDGFGGAPQDASVGGTTLFSFFTTVIGTDGADFAYGGSAHETLAGGGGDDTLFGFAGDDSIDGGAGADLIQGQQGNDTITGGAGSDTIQASDASNADSIAGGEDTGDQDVLDLVGPTAVSVTFTGDEAGTYTMGAASGTFSEFEEIRGTTGNDTFDASADSSGVDIYGGDGNDSIVGGSGADLLDGWDGKDTLDGGAGDDTLLAGFDDGTGDVFIGGAGTDTYQIDGTDAEISAFNIDLATGTDNWSNTYSGIENVIGGDQADTIAGDTNANELSGGLGDDRLSGRDGSDILSGGAGADSLDGGADADTFRIEDGFGADTILGGDTATIGQDFDTIDLSALTGPATVTFSGDGAGILTDGADTASFSGIERITGTDQADSIEGSADAAGIEIVGGLGDDTITGGIGGDTIDGGAGADRIVGDGSVPDPVIRMEFEDAGGTAADSSGNAHNGTYQNGATAGGTGWDGSGTAVLLDGVDDYVEIPDDPAFDLNEGTLSIRFNADTLSGESMLISRDSSGFDGGGHVGISVLSDGSLFVRMQDTSASYEITTSAGTVGTGTWHHVALTFGADGMRLYLDGTEVGSNAHTGGIAGNNEPWTLGAGQEFSGDNVANGLNDWFDGALDEFALFGSALSAGQVAGLATNGVTALGAGGNDSLTGGAGADTLIGGDGQNTLVGSEGDDSLVGNSTDGHTFLIGGAGADTLDGTDGGWDLAHYYSSSSAVNIDLTDGLTETGGDAAGDTLTGIEQIDGSTFADTITGDNSSMMLKGWDGNDSITGGTGNDSLEGGEGNDSLVGLDGNDSVDGGAGNDVIDGGLGADSIIGGDGDDSITGGDGNDLLVTGAGQDTLVGGAGDDTLTNAAGDDSLVGGIGNDSIVASLGNDTLEGGAGNDILIGGQDNDSILGGADNDLIAGDAFALSLNDTGTDGYAGVSTFNAMPTSQLTYEITFSSTTPSTNTIFLSYATSENPDGNELLFQIVSGNLALVANDGVSNVTADVSGLNLFDGNAHTLAFTLDATTGAVEFFVDGASVGTGTTAAGVLTPGGTFIIGQEQDTVGGGFQSSQIFQGEIYQASLWGDIRTASEIANDAETLGADGSDPNLVANWVPDPQNGRMTDTQNENDLILAGDAAIVDVYSGNDTIDGGTGNDTIYAGDGADSILGGDGADTIFFGAGDDTVDGGAGNDLIDDVGGTTAAGANLLSGGAGNDTIWAGAGADTLRGGTGADSLTGDEDADTFIIEDAFGADTIVGGGGGIDADTIDFSEMVASGINVSVTSAKTGTATDGTDTLTFSEIESFVLTDQADTLDGYNAYWSSLYVDGGAGDDSIVGANDPGFTDTLVGGIGNDTLRGWNGSDSLVGGVGDDELIGDLGNDTLEGGSGADTLSSWNGAASMSGGDDADLFYAFDAAATVAAGGGFDGVTIAGGEGGVDSDTVDLSNFGGGATVTYSGNEAGSVTDGTDTLTYSEIENFNLTGQADSVDATATTTGIDVNAGGGDDTITGGTGADTIDGGAGADSILGGDGNDSIGYAVGGDTVYGGAGDDTLQGGFSAGSDDALLDGGTGNDRIVTFGANDTVFGGAGLDTIVGDSGNELLDGGDDADYIWMASGSDTVYGGSGDDTIDVGSGGADTIYGGTGADTITGSSDQQTFIMEDGFGADTIDGGTGGIDEDVLDFSALTTGITVDWITSESGTAVSGLDTITWSEIERIVLTNLADSVDASAETVDINIDGADGDDTLRGGSGADTIAGGDGNDRLYGGAGNDRLEGGAGIDSFYTDAGADTMLGGAGRDRYYVDDGFNGDVVDFGSEEIITGDASTAEFLSFYAVTTTVDIVFTSGTGGNAASGAGEALTFSYADGFEGAFGVGGTFDASLAGFDVLLYDYGGMTSVVGSAYGDRLWAFAADPLGITNRYYDGGGGDDDIDTGDGNDTILGGTGNDTIVSRDGADSVDAGDGDDLVYDGAGNSTLIGGTGNDTIEGGAGADMIEGGAGADSLDGGVGNDRFYVTGADTVTGGTGGDRVTILDGFDGSVINFGGDVIVVDSSAFGEELDLWGLTSSVTITFTGGTGGTLTSGAGESLTFSHAEEFVSALDQDAFFDARLADWDIRFSDNGTNSTVYGSAYDDDIQFGGSTAAGLTARYYDGGGGDDYLFAGNADDTLLGGDGNDTVIGSGGNESLDGGAGDDSVAGWFGDDTIRGGAGSDTLRGEHDADTFIVEDGFGADSIVGGESVSTGTDRDRLDFSAMAATGISVTYSAAEAGSATDGTDTLTFSEIEQVSLTEQADTVVATSDTAGVDVDGGGGNDSLVGGSGGDTLVGGAGDDYIEGGAGDDLLRTGSGQDTLIGGEGSDTLLNSAGDDSLVGGAGDDSIVASAGNDTLDGGTGNDTLIGGDGSDLILGGDGNDSIRGDDDISYEVPVFRMGVDFTLNSGTFEGGANDITLSVSGSSTALFLDDDGQIGGDSPNETFTDPNQQVVIDGVAYDVLFDDTAQFSNDATGDVYTFAILDVDLDGSGESAQAGEDGTLLIQIGGPAIPPGANLTSVNGTTNGAPAPYDLTGFETGGADSIDAGSGDDTVTGEFGADTIAGGTGADSLSGGEDADTFVVEAGFGNDTIVGGETGNDSDTIDASALTGAVTVTFTGDEAGTITDGTDTITFSEIENVVTGGGDDTIDASADSSGVGLFTNDGQDTIVGGTGADTIRAGAGNDQISDGEGDDDVDAGDGNDTIGGWYGNDTLRGGAGDDRIEGGDGADSIEGGTGADLLVGYNANGLATGSTTVDTDDSAADTIIGGAGADTIAGGRGADSLSGDDDADTFLLTDGFGNDTIVGGESVTTGTDYDTIDLSALTGPVTVTFTGDGAGTITDGTDTITFSEIENVFTGSGADSVDASADSSGVGIFTNDGQDTVVGGSGIDYIDGGAGDDTLDGGAGADTIQGGSGNDSIRGNDGTSGADGADQIDGGDGDDTISGDLGDDTILGGAGNDAVEGAEGADSIDGGIGDDYLAGYDVFGLGASAAAGNTNPNASGDDGSADTIEGGDGSDTILGGGGADSLSGGADADTFAIQDGFGNDTIIGGENVTTGTDYDTIDLSALTGPVTVTFTGDGAGTITDGTDTITFSEIERIIGTDQADVIDASADTAGIVIDGGGGNDTITGGSGNDTIDGGAGADVIAGGTGNDRLTSGTGNDTIVLTNGSGQDTITDFDTGDDNTDGQYNDQFDVSGMTADDGSPLRSSDVSTTDDAGDARLNFPASTSNATVTMQGTTTSQMDEGSEYQAAGIPCFAAGTLIATPDGQVPVELLRPGDLVLTRDNGPQTLLWSALRRIGPDELAACPQHKPVLVRAGKFGDHPDLVVSPQHGLLLAVESEEIFVRATHLARLPGGFARVMEGCRRVTYCHLFFERHEVVFSNGLPSESYFPGPQVLSSLDRLSRKGLGQILPRLDAIESLSDATRLYGEPARPYSRWKAMPDTARALVGLR